MYPPFLDVTPFGPYCKVCNVPLSIQAGILAHGKEVHPECHFKNATVIRDVQRHIDILRKTHANDLTPFLTNQRCTDPTWFCTGCFRSFSKGFNYTRHLERNKDCSNHHGGKMDCYLTICGRIGPKSYIVLPITSTSTIVSTESTVSTLTMPTLQSTIDKSMVVKTSSKVPPTLLTTREQADEILSPFVRPDEDVHELSLIYLPILAPGFEGKMKEMLSYSSFQTGEDGILFKWLDAGREWLGKYAAGHIANVSANVRSRLAEFEQKEIDGTTVGTRTFTLRRGIPRLMGELDAALRFFYRYPTTLFDSYKSPGLLTTTKLSMIESAIIPKILFTAAAEEPDDHGRLPVACLYCLSRGFSSKGGIDLVMNECGWFASRISSMLHLLRAGVCGYLVTLSVDGDSDILSRQEMDIVNRIQHGRVTNLLAPYVKRLRDLNSRKPPVKSNTVNPNGDITSGGFTFPHSVWSTIIPRVDAISRACFTEIFEGSVWESFMEKPVSMTDWVQLEASITDNGTSIWLRDVVVRKEMQPVLAKLQSVMELCFFGLGVGAVRHEEVIRLTVLSCQWHNSYLYYWTESLKKGSLRVSSTPKLVEHRLSLTLSRIVLLARHAMSLSADVGNTESLFPVSSGVSMLGLVQEIFDFDCPPQTLNVRHLFTSIGNIILPENGPGGSDGCFVSDSILTEKSGHTQGTGRRSYGTWLVNSEEALYDRYHISLGESTIDPPPLEFTPFSDSVLKSALKELLGRDADYRSSQQKCMIEYAANSISRHAFVGLPCGQGKSLSWMVPALASYMAGRHVGVRIIILPYKFLLGHVVHHAVTRLGLLHKKIVVSSLDSTQIGSDVLPPQLEVDSLPNLLFLNLDGAATLLRYHLGHLQNLAKRSLLKRIYVDEFQQILVEYGFRSSYQSLRELGRIGAPVMCLSGSLPCNMATSLMSYCGLVQDIDTRSVDIVTPTDPIGDGFSFHVETVEDIAASAIEYVLKFRVGACHVLCSSIALVQEIHSGLSSHLKVLSVTSESSFQEQVVCAKNWYKGEYDVLVSTVVALVGNENRFCKTIVVAGFLFNVSSLVQAIGRLRPEQRGPSSRVQVFRFPIRTANRHDAKQQCLDLLSELLETGCVTSAMKQQFARLFSPIGLQEVLSLKEGCYLQHLSNFYGFVRLPCDRCDLCNIRKVPQQEHKDVVVSGTLIGSSPAKTAPSPVSSSSVFLRKMPAQIPIVLPMKRPRIESSNVLLGQQVSEETNNAEKELRRKAKWVFCELQYRCLLCGSTICNGECVPGCYRCGSRSHSYTVCTYDTVRLGKILPNKGVCFGCFDTRQHLMVNHDMKSCPLKRRLKRLVFLDHQKRGSTFDEYLRQLYSSEMSFVRMVASFADKTSLGR
jgi:hypothetical protein